MSVPVLLAMLVLLMLASAADAAPKVEVLACPTILNSLHADWVATRNLYAQYGPSAEANPIVRAVGPDLYFIGAVGAVSKCKQDSRWQTIGAVIFLVQTWAVNTHVQIGTASQVPMLVFKMTW